MTRIMRYLSWFLNPNHQLPWPGRCLTEFFGSTWAALALARWCLLAGSLHGRWGPLGGPLGGPGAGWNIGGTNLAYCNDIYIMHMWTLSYPTKNPQLYLYMYHRYIIHNIYIYTCVSVMAIHDLSGHFHREHDESVVDSEVILWMFFFFPVT